MGASNGCTFTSSGSDSFWLLSTDTKVTRRSFVSPNPCNSSILVYTEDFTSDLCPLFKINVAFTYSKSSSSGSV